MERKRATVNRYVCQERVEKYSSPLTRNRTSIAARRRREGVRTNEFLRLILGSCSRMNDISAIVGNLADPFYEIFFTIFFVNSFGWKWINNRVAHFLISLLFNKLVNNDVL